MAFLLAALAFVLLLLVEHVLLPESAHQVVHAPSGEQFAHLGALRGGIETYAVVTALLIHSLLAGLALGAQPELRSALVIFVAIISHKTAAGFALGVSLVRHAMPRGRAWGLLALFALATPAGILVGALLDEGLRGPAQLRFEGTFLALAAGTFTYVATLDILRDEFLEPGGRFEKWLLVASGTALMAILAIWV